MKICRSDDCRKVSRRKRKRLYRFAPGGLLFIEAMLFLGLCGYVGSAPFWFDKTGSGGYPLENFELLSGAAPSLALGGSDGGIPAEVLRVDNYREYLSIGFAPLFEGANYFSSVYFLPFSDGQYIYGSVSSINVSDIPGANEMGEDLGRFGAGEVVVRSGYTRVINRRFSVGSALKVYYQRIGDYQDSVFSLCGGAGIRSGNTDLYFVAENLLPPVASIMGTEVYPSARVCLSHSPPIPGSNLKIFLGALFEGIFSGYTSKLFWSCGAEYENPRGVKWRMGINPASYFAAGIGLVFRRVDFDYGVVWHPLDFVHILSIKVKFSIEPSEAERQASEGISRAEAEREAVARRAKLERAILEEERQKLARERKISALFLSASRDFGDKKFSSAMKKLSDILKIDPSNDEARRLLAEIKAITSEATVKRKLIEMENDYKKSDYARVVENARWILDVQPENEKARIYNYLASARIFIQEKKYQEARAELYEVVKIQPTNAEALGLLKRIQTVMDMEVR